MKADIPSIIKRLEKAAGPDRAIDGDIASDVMNIYTGFACRRRDEK